MTDDDRLRALVSAAAEGDGVALGELVRATQPIVWRVCTALGTAGEEADLVQEVYLRAIKAMPAYRADAPVRVWLTAIARHVCADDVRRRQRRRRLAERLAANARDVHHPAIEPVDDVLAVIAPERREAFVLTQYLGFTYEEAAQALGCPIGTVRSRVSRARADLATLIARADAR